MYFVDLIAKVEIGLWIDIEAIVQHFLITTQFSHSHLEILPSLLILLAMRQNNT